MLLPFELGRNTNCRGLPELACRRSTPMARQFGSLFARKTLATALIAVFGDRIRLSVGR
jgi:hypothetical protein